MKSNQSVSCHLWCNWNEPKQTTKVNDLSIQQDNMVHPNGTKISWNDHQEQIAQQGSGYVYHYPVKRLSPMACDSPHCFNRAPISTNFGERRLPVGRWFVFVLIWMRYFTQLTLLFSETLSLAERCGNFSKPKNRSRIRKCVGDHDSNRCTLWFTTLSRSKFPTLAWVRIFPVSRHIDTNLSLASVATAGLSHVS